MAVSPLLPLFQHQFLLRAETLRLLASSCSYYVAPQRQNLKWTISTPAMDCAN